MLLQGHELSADRTRGELWDHALGNFWGDVQTVFLVKTSQTDIITLCVIIHSHSDAVIFWHHNELALIFCLLHPINEFLQRLLCELFKGAELEHLLNASSVLVVLRLFLKGGLFFQTIKLFI